MLGDNMALSPTAKGIHRYDNLDPMQGPAQMSTIANDVDALIDPTVPALTDLPASGNWPNRTIYVLATKALYLWDAGWKRITPARGTATGTTDLSGLLDIAHGLSAAPSQVSLTPVFTTDAVATVFKPMRGAITSSKIQVVCIRTDTSARLLTTAVSIDWVAWP